MSELQIILHVGLGRYLYACLKARDHPQTLGGALLVTILAVALEVLLGRFQHLARLAAEPTSRAEWHRGRGRFADHAPADETV